VDQLLPVRGFCIGAPRPAELDRFLEFVEAELVPRHVNTLILRVDYNYAYESHPELRDPEPLSRAQVQQLVTAAKRHQIRIIPQINLLGHQSWANRTLNLLRHYPEFDETPQVQMPAKYQWPNPDGLYCKSYCPLHPKVHEVVFALVDEVCEAFEASAFHAGMDEVFYLGDDKCPRCAGKDKAELFAGEVRTIREHLAQKGRALWIWGDRLLDGKTTGLGMWEASLNDTHRAIDSIPKDITICDWHYERPDQTAVYFAMKGFHVVTCPWRVPKNAVLQVQDMVRFRKHSTPEMRQRFLGVVQTVWSGPGSFLDRDYAGKASGKDAERNPWLTFQAMFDELEKLTE
jgi:N-acetyl-beta-hexosaminidase